MKIGFIGLGKMGQSMVQRLLKDNHEVVIYDQDKEKLKNFNGPNIYPAAGIKDLIAKLGDGKKVVWLMIPSKKEILDEILFGDDGLSAYLSKGDVIIDGGNSYFRDSIARAEKLAQKGIDFIDCGCSGGPFAKNGFAIMAGGRENVYKRVSPIMLSLSGSEVADYVGPAGSGHFVKMVHNAIEYGMMESYAEGFELLKRGPFKNLDLAQVAHIWNHGSVVRSFLCELIEKFLAEDQNLENIKSVVDDSGEGRWALMEAINNDVHFYTLANALFARFRSREETDDYSLKFLAALRNSFGGHKVYSDKE